MAEIISDSTSHIMNDAVKVPSNAKTNAALTLGIIGTALSGITALGGLGSVAGVFSNKSSNGSSGTTDATKELMHNEVYLERRMVTDELSTQKEMYEWKIQNLKNLTDAFFDSYQRDVDNSFKLYKFNRDNNDVINHRIDELDKKVDVMQAIRPYQDALIDNKINTNALIADFNLAKRTCKMIEGQVVLPSTPVVSGYGSYSTCPCVNNTVSAS